MTTDKPSFAEREEARRDRALERAGRFARYASNATHRRGDDIAKRPAG